MKTLSRITLSIALVMSLAGSLSCQREPLVISDLYGTFDLVIRPRWSNLETRPTGMTAYIYPVSGEAPRIISSNNVDSINVCLDPGGYRIILMNQSPSEFPSLEFRHMESYYDSEVVSVECDNSSSFPISKSNRMGENPDILAIDVCNELNCTEVEIDEAGVEGERVRKVVTLKPHIVVSTLYVTIPVDGIYNAWSASGCIDGMSRSLYLTYFDNSEEQVSHKISPWEPHYESVSSNYGSLTASVTTLGLPGTSLYLSSGASIETGRGKITKSQTDPQFNAEDILLHMKVLLVDKKTVIDTTYAVGDIITREINEPLVLNLSPKDYLFLPYVQPVDGSGKAGFDVDVDGWNEEIHDIEF